jgi:hypothetical protein
MDKAISDYISGASRFVADVTRDAVHRREDLAAQEERDSGLQILVAALLEAKVKDELVISLIQKYYGLNEIEAEERLIAEKTINSPCKYLETYLVRSEGYTRNEAYDFILDHNVPDLLRNNKGLWKLPPKELLSKVK